MAGRYRLSPGAQDPRDRRTSTAAQPIRGLPKPITEIAWILRIRPEGRSRVHLAQIQFRHQAIEPLTGGGLLAAPGLAQPSRYGMVAIGKFLEVDAFLQRHRLVGANAVDDVLKTEPGGRCEHDQRTANEAVLARPPRVVVAFATVLRPGHRAETQR